MTREEYLLGCDLLGAETASAIYTDSKTITDVQKAIAALPQTKAGDTMLPDYLVKQAHGDALFIAFASEIADGKIGPKTRAVLSRFNSSYRGEPNDGSNITDGTLASLKIKPSAAPGGLNLSPEVVTVPRPSVASNTPSTPSMSPMAGPSTPLEGDKLSTLHIAGIAGLAAVGLGAIGYGLFGGHRSTP